MGTITLRQQYSHRPVQGPSVLRAPVPRRRFLASLAGAAPAIYVTACSRPGERQGPAEQTRLKPGTTLFFMNDMGGPYGQVMEEWAQTFYEKTQVRVELSPGTQDYGNKLLASFASGTPPDIFRYL